MIASLALVAALTAQTPALPQDSEGPRNHVFFETGAAVGTTSPYGASGLAIGLHVTSAPRGAAGIDFGLSSYVDPLTHGHLNVLTDLDAVYLPPETSQPQVALRAGVTSFLMSGMAIGLNAGAGVMVHLSRTTSFRMDYTYRRFLSEESGGLQLSALTLGFGFDY